MLGVYIVLLAHFSWAQNNICRTQDCIRLSEYYRATMNLSVSPCDNFYEFACGNYVKTRIPEGTPIMNRLSDMQKRFDLHLLELLENTNPDNATYSLKQTKTFYDSCINEVAQENYGTVSLEHLPTLFGGWHILNQSTFNETSFEWEVLAGNLTMLGVDPIITPVVELSPNKSGKYILYLKPFKMLLRENEDYFIEASKNTISTMEIYNNYVLELLEMLGVEKGQKLRDMVFKVFSFEKRLAQIARKGWNELQVKRSNPMTYQKLKETYNNIRWEKLFNRKFSHPLAEMSDSLVIHVVNPHYFEYLNIIITSESPTTVHNYLMFRLLNEFVWLLHPKFRKPVITLYEKRYNETHVIHDVRKKCWAIVKSAFFFSIADDLVRKLISKEERSEAERMLLEIKNAMRDKLETSQWMKDSAKKMVIRKIEAMKTALDYLDDEVNEAEIQDYYKSMNVGPVHYFPNAFWLWQKVKMDSLSNLNRKPEPINRRLSELFDFNAYYDIESNKIAISGGLLRFPVFVQKTPPFVNFGSIGMVMGHEISHGFDSISVSYNKYGKPSKSWDDVTSEKYRKKVQCFVDQYSQENDPITGRNYHGSFVLRESIADNNALRIVYQAYLQEMKNTTDHRKLPGLESYSSDQMFFISYASTFCELLNSNEIHRLESDEHTFGATRVNLPLRNFEKFSEVFECDAESAMRKEEKDMCRIW